MSRITAALECAVAEVIANRGAAGERQTARLRAATNRAFARILRLIAPRIRHFIRQYGLAQHWDDADQCCAIAVHRAIEAYDPTKAQFTTFVNWQIRGELQSLRFRLMTDQRPSARKVGATTVSLHQTATGLEGEERALEALLVDEEALGAAEAGASTYLARAATECLIEEFVRKGRRAALGRLRRGQPKRRPARLHSEEQQPGAAMLETEPDEIARIEAQYARDREVLLSRSFGEAQLHSECADTGLTKERIRQIGRRAAKGMAELVVTNPKFAVMAEYAAAAGSRRKAASFSAGTRPVPEPVAARA